MSELSEPVDDVELGTKSAMATFRAAPSISLYDNGLGGFSAKKKRQAFHQYRKV